MTKGALPWRTVRDKDETEQMKRAARTPGDIRRQMFHGCPLEYEQIFDHLDGLGYYNYPNYNLICQVRAHSFARTLTDHVKNRVNARYHRRATVRLGDVRHRAHSHTENGANAPDAAWIGRRQPVCHCSPLTPHVL
jgi:hypothetical protein